MRLPALLAAISVAVTGVVATQTLNVDVVTSFRYDLSVDNYYGAPIPPWEFNGHPGWYYGTQVDLYLDLTCLDGIICEILNLFPLNCLRCPTTPHSSPITSHGYTQTFSNLTGATQAAGYLTYGLVDTVADCMSMCDSVSGCTFVNTYYDVHGKGGSTQLTCSLFSSCHDSSDAINRGGQSQSDGTVDYISNSEGWCKK